MTTHSISSYQRESKRYPYYASCPGAMINTHQLEIPMSHGSKGVRVIEVQL